MTLRAACSSSAPTGTRVTCFTVTNVQILTQKALQLCAEPMQRASRLVYLRAHPKGGRYSVDLFYKYKSTNLVQKYKY